MNEPYFPLRRAIPATPRSPWKLPWGWSLLLLLALLTYAGTTAAVTLPNAEQQQYLTITTATGKQPSSFNYNQTTTRTVTLIGKTVAIDQASTRNTLYKDYNLKYDIQALNIYAETLIIRSALRFPQTTVTIHAKKIQFVDSAGVTAAICTTPKTLSARPGEGLAGAAGLAAGDLNLYTTAMTPLDSSAARFQLLGGGGQPAGLGRNGKFGSTMKTYTQATSGVPSSNECPAGTVYIFETYPNNLTIQGTNVWPSDGENAVAAGKPGLGGMGGRLSSTIDLSSFVNLLGGASGQKGVPTYGGAHGTPEVSRHVEWVNAWGSGLQFLFVTDEEHTSVAGQNAGPPDPDQAYGFDGSAASIDTPNPWFHPRLLQGIVKYGNALLAAKARTEAIALASNYLTLYADYKKTPDYNTLSSADKTKFESDNQALKTIKATPPLKTGAAGWGDYR